MSTVMISWHKAKFSSCKYVCKKSLIAETF